MPDGTQQQPGGGRAPSKNSEMLGIKVRQARGFLLMDPGNPVELFEPLFQRLVLILLARNEEQRLLIPASSKTVQLVCAGGRQATLFQSV